MSNPADLTQVPNLSLPTDDDMFLIEAIGPINMTRPECPTVKGWFTRLNGQQPHSIEDRSPKFQVMLDLPVSDLMTLGPGVMIQGQMRQRHPKGFLEELSVSLEMSSVEVKEFRELENVLGREGAFPLDSAWEMIDRLHCLCFRGKEFTVLIPCLDAWRFILASSSQLLDLSTTPGLANTLSEAREKSYLITDDGRKVDLPLDPLPVPEITPATQEELRELTEAQKQRQALLDSSKLHLSVPAGFHESEIPFLAWCFTDELVFNAVNRFYTSVASSRANIPGSNQKSGFSYPLFLFPFIGRPRFKLQGVKVNVGQDTFFFALHIDRCDASIPMPKEVIHALRTETDDTPSIEEQTKGEHHRAPKPKFDQEKGELDSMQAPDARLKTLHFGLKRDRLPHLSKSKLSSNNKTPHQAPPQVSGGGREDREGSLGQKEPGGLGGRPLHQGEKPLEPPPSREVKFISQFCDLLGVCQELNRRGIEYQFLPIGRDGTDDPTTPFPSEAGPSATWVGKGVQARRALIAELRHGDLIAYALEWERMEENEYGKLLLCTAGKEPVSETALLNLLRQCARERGVWPEQAGGNLKLIGINHRQPHAEEMSFEIDWQLENLIKALPDKAVHSERPAADKTDTPARTPKKRRSRGYIA